ncbi:unnamed protein product [Camellia sinensis]
MIRMQYNLKEKGVLEVGDFDSEAKWKKKEGSFASNEPISVLDTRRSPSPSTSTSTSTLSSSLGGGGVGSSSGSTDNTASLAAVSGDNLWPPERGPADLAAACGGRKDEWASELQPIPVGLEVSGGERFGLGLEDWESLLSESGQDQSLLRWIASEVDDGSFSLKQLLQSSNPNEFDGNVIPAVIDQSSGFKNDDNSVKILGPNNVNLQIPNLGPSLSNLLPNGVIYQQQQQLQNPDEKLQIFNPQLFTNNNNQINQSQNLFTPPLYAQQQDPLRLLQPHPKRQNLGVFDPGLEFLLRQQLPPLPPLTVPKQEAAAAGGDQTPPPPPPHHQLCKAAELILAGNFSHAQGILARLNHQLSPVSKPFQRATFYFKEAVQLSLIPNPVVTPRTPTPFDGIFKMGAYKLLSEVSPLIQFMNFTSNQALLDALDDDTRRVHVIDFDIGFGAQWASFMQELPGKCSRGTPSLKITAFASPSTHHPLELGLMHENLTQFANEIGVNFELEVVNFDGFDPNSYSVPIFRSSDEAIVVNFPIWACSNRLSVLPSLLRFIKQLSPKVIVSMECGFERADLPISHHLLLAIQYYEILLDSIDAVNANSETMNKIEKFLVQPRIESIVSGRLHGPDHMPHWRDLFAAAGFAPVAFSNFAETQAECVLRRSQVRGFHVEKPQASLTLCWQRRQLMTGSVWRC